MSTEFVPDDDEAGEHPRMVILFVCPVCGGQIIWQDAKCRLCEGDLDWSKVRRPAWFDESVFE